MAWAKIDDMKLPNGDYVTVCLSHERVVCRQCCVDFSFELNDGDCISSDDEGIFSLGSDGLVPRDVSFTQVANSSYGRRQPAGKQETGLPDMVSSKGLGDQNVSPYVIDFSRWASVPERTAPSGKIFPAQFNHSMKASTTPQELFSAGSKRFYNRDNKFEMLIYTDGSCIANASGGCGFVFGPTQSRHVALKLEHRGLDGKVYKQTSNRAELRAVIAALRFRAWYGEGFTSLVIATDSSYVAYGATDWVRGWWERDWLKSNGHPVTNRDLWEALLLEVEKLHDLHLTVSFWRIPREWNHEADKAAKHAATNYKPVEEFVDVMGVMI